MAEKGIIVNDATTGESVAARDALEQDDGTNSRIIQLVDRSQRAHGFDITAGAGKIRSNVQYSDSCDMATVPSAITSSALTVGDKTTLVAVCHYVTLSAANSITITPIVLDDDNEMVGFLTPKIISSFKPAIGSSPEAFHKTAGTTHTNISEILSWNVLGAYKVGIHFGYSSTDGNMSSGENADIYAAMISGPVIGDPAASSPTAGSYSAEETAPGE